MLENLLIDAKAVLIQQRYKSHQSIKSINMLLKYTMIGENNQNNKLISKMIRIYRTIMLI